MWSVVRFLEIEQALRLDGEYYQPLYLSCALAVSNGDTLETRSMITHPTEIKRVYEQSGVQILLAQNIRHNRLDFSTTVYMPRSVMDQIVRNRLLPDNVVMTRSGANFGDAAVYKGIPPEIYACADCLIIRPKGIPGGYLSTYLNTAIGRALLTRGAYGMAQPHIAPNYLYTMRVPRWGEDFERDIDSMVVEAYEWEERSEALYTEAETLLLAELGLDEVDLSHQPTYTQSFNQAWGAGRLDAEYFQPKYYRVLKAISSTAEGKEWPIENIGQFSEPLKYGTSTKLEYLQEGVPFLRIADVSRRRFSLDSVRYILGKQAEEEKQASVRTGDVLISRSGTLGLTVAIPAYLDGAIFGSYFIRARPDGKRVVPEYLALFMNSLAGQAQVERLNTGAIQTNLTIPAIESIQVPLPPLEVQKAIAGKALDSFAEEDEAKRLLEEAKRRVEELVLGENMP